MKLSSFTAIGCLIGAVAGLPAPQIVYVTEYNTVYVTAGEENLVTPTATSVAVAGAVTTTSAVESGLNWKVFVSDVASFFIVGNTATLAAAATTTTNTPVAATTFPVTTTTALAATTTSTPIPTPVAPAPTTATTTSSTSQASASGSLFSGQGTYYSTGLGACGWTSQDTDYICAISHALYDANNVNANPNDNSLCGKKIRAFYGSNSVEVTVVDRCEGCQYYDLDFSPSAFSQLADQSLGRIDITWEWV